MSRSGPGGAPDHPGSPVPSITSSPSRRRHPGWRVILAVAVGGLVGSLLHTGTTRTLLSLAGASPAGALDRPLADTAVLVVVNLVGSFLLGMLTARSARWNRPTWLATGLGVGVLGSFTTLSGVLVVWTVLLPHGDVTDPAGPLIILGTAVLGLAVQGLSGTAAALGGLYLGGVRERGVRS